MEALESSRLFEENLELNPRQKIFDCLISTLVLVSTKADPTAKEQNCKQGTVGDYGVGGIEMILALLGGLSVDCPTSRITNLSASLGAGVSCSKRSPRPWCHCGAGFGIVKLSFSKRAG